MCLRGTISQSEALEDSMKISKKSENRTINTIRFLAADAVQKANSGHPGLPKGADAMAYTLWTRHLRINPHNVKWPGRNLFILSSGHGSAFLYTALK
jgi:transketolase